MWCNQNFKESVYLCIQKIENAVETNKKRKWSVFILAKISLNIASTYNVQPAYRSSATTFSESMSSSVQCRYILALFIHVLQPQKRSSKFKDVFIFTNVFKFLICTYVNENPANQGVGKCVAVLAIASSDRHLSKMLPVSGFFISGRLTKKKKMEREREICEVDNFATPGDDYYFMW